jgi:hypothetical protein
VLEKLFTNLVGIELTEAKIEELRLTFENILTEEFNLNDSTNLDKVTGKNLLIFHVIKDYLDDFLKKQSELIAHYRKESKSYKVLFIEKMLSTDYTLSVNQEMLTFKIIGKIDRVDQLDDHIQIIDYKSGDVRSKNFDIEKLFADEQDPKNDYCFQLLLYLWLFGKDEETPAYRSMHSGVWSFRKIQEGVKNIMIDSKSKDTNLGREQLEVFEVYLTGLLQQLFDINDDFIQTPNPDNCLYCPYTNICQR